MPVDTCKKLRHRFVNCDHYNKMSDLNDDLLNYELGDDLDDQAFYGADEDELLLSDDELEKNVTIEEKKQLKEEAEQWVNSKISESHTHAAASLESVKETQNDQYNQKTIEPVEVSSSEILPSAVTVQVTSAVMSISNLEHSEQQSQGDSDVSTSEESPAKISVALQESEQRSVAIFKQPAQQQKSLSPNQKQHQNNQNQEQQFSLQHDPEHLCSPKSTTTNHDEVSSSSCKEIESDSFPVLSYSMSQTESSPVIQSPQESSSVGIPGVGEFSDPREDPDDEREERTNIKHTSEREMDEAGGTSVSPDKHPRFLPVKRGNGIGNGGQIGIHANRLPLRGGIFPIVPQQRPLLRYPHALIPGQFPNPAHLAQQQVHQHLSQNPYAMHNVNHIHDSNLQTSPKPPRHAFGAVPLRMDFRQGGGNYRHPTHNMYSQMPHDFNASGNTGGPNALYNQNYNLHHARPIYRSDVSNVNQVTGLPGIRPRMRMQRPQGMPIQGSPNYVNALSVQRHPQSQITSTVPATGTSTVTGSTTGAVSTPISIAMPTSNPATIAPSMRPSKVLINPNFKGGVEAATNKFIKETQFMHTISSHVSHLQSDEELLRQQEEFINKNRQQIEKRRHERSSPLPMRSLRSRSRSHSRSRDCSYSPPKRNVSSNGDRGDRHFDRGDRNDRDRCRANSRDRYISSGGGGSIGASAGGGSRAGRFRRGSSRDYEVRNYGKRRRSASPVRRRIDRDRSDLEEDEETRAYRLEIEKQKTLREKILRDKEMRRRRAAEEKQHEDKQGNSNTSEDHQQQQQDQPQKLKPIIVTESKMISLKKNQQQQQQLQRQQQQQQQQDAYDADRSHQLQQQQQQLQNQQQQNASSRYDQLNNRSGTNNRSLPTAKILPAAKRTLSDHLSNAATGITAATAIIKPVIKKQPNEIVTPPQPPEASIAPKCHLIASNEDDDELDYDEVELLLEEDRLLADTPSPPPLSRSPSPITKALSPTDIAPTSGHHHHYRSSSKTSSSSNKNISSTTPSSSSNRPFSSSNRRVVLKSSSSASSSSRAHQHHHSSNSNSRDLNDDNRRHGNNNSSRDNHRGDSRDHHSSSGSSSTNKKGIFDRLDSRKIGLSDSGKRKIQRIVLKNSAD